MKINHAELFDFLKGIFAAALSALALTLACAAVLRVTGGASETALGIINGVIRIIAVGVGCFFYCKKNGLLRGAITGVFAHLAVFALFGVLGAGFFINARFFINSIICVFAGCIFGVLFSNLNKNP